MKTFLGVPLPTFGKQKASGLSSVTEGRGWFRIFESFSGAWQRNIVVDRNLVQSHHAVFACQTLLASDIAKNRIKLMQLTADEIWVETKNPAYSPVLRKPNAFQNRMQFVESWILSKLSRGNTYVLKQRDARNVVVALYVLDPSKVTPAVADNGAIFYQLQADNIAGVRQAVMVPAREIIHDRFNCLFHPLVGLSPIFACGLAATLGLNIQQNSASLFANQSQPGGILTSPITLTADEAKEMKDAWTENFGGANKGKVAVLGGGLKYERMALTAEESQLIEQSKWTGEVVCSVYHVPPYKIGLGVLPSYNNIQALNVEYGSQGLQSLIEALELCLDEGLGTGETLGTEVDTENLLRMDSATQMQVLKDATGIMKLNEQRKKLSLPPVEGGDAVYLQQQNYSSSALNKRDAQEDPFASGSKASPAPQVVPVTLALPAPTKLQEAPASKDLSSFKAKTLFAHRRAA